MPKSTELRGRQLWSDFVNAKDADVLELAAKRVLAHLGCVRHVVGNSSSRGQRIANQMNAVRQKRDKAFRVGQDLDWMFGAASRRLTTAEQEARSDEIAAIPF